MENLSKQCYAYPDRKLYPVHTKQAALNSYKEFQKDLDKYSTEQIDMIAQGFIKSAAALGFSYPDQEPEMEKQASLKVCDEDGTEVQMGKIASVQDVEKVVAQIQDNREEFNMPFIRKIAQVAYKTADDNHVEGEVMVKLARFAGFGLCEPEEVAVEFRKRGALIKMSDKMESDFYEAYRALEKPANPDILQKQAAAVCDMLHEMDKLCKLAQYYGTKIQKPEDVCFRYGIDDFIEEVEDYLRVPSTDTVLSKQALLDNKGTVQNFLQQKYGYKTSTDEEVLQKVASLSKTGIEALVQVLS